MENSKVCALSTAVEKSKEGQRTRVEVVAQWVAHIQEVPDSLSSIPGWERRGEVVIDSEVQADKSKEASGTTIAWVKAHESIIEIRELVSPSVCLLDCLKTYQKART